MSGIIGKKVGMTTIFNADGQAVPCTLIEAGPCVVTQVRTEDKDGYKAIQLGYGDKKEKNTSRPLVGHFKKAGTTPKRKLLEFKEFEKMVYIMRWPRCSDTNFFCLSINTVTLKRSHT